MRIHSLGIWRHQRVGVMSGHGERRPITVAPTEADEPEAVRARYARRPPEVWRYGPLNPAVLLATQERQRATADLFVGLGWVDLSELHLLEVGCGTGCNLLEFLRLGFKPEHLQGIELLAAGVERARKDLPPSVRIALGDAARRKLVRSRGQSGYCVPVNGVLLVVGRLVSAEAGRYDVEMAPPGGRHSAVRFYR